MSRRARNCPTPPVPGTPRAYDSAPLPSAALVASCRRSVTSQRGCRGRPRVSRENTDPPHTTQAARRPNVHTPRRGSTSSRSPRIRDDQGIGFSEHDGEADHDEALLVHTFLSVSPSSSYT